MLKKTPFCDILKDFSENEPSGTVVIWEHSLERGHILALQHVWGKNEGPLL